MSVLTGFIAAYFRSGLRGSTRLTDFLSNRLTSMQNVPIEIEGGTLYADLRIATARAILAYPKCRSGEDIVMRKVVCKGDVVYDIGAHLGFYTLLLSNLAGGAGRVFAFEPNPELQSSLRRTLDAIENVESFDFALSDSEGELNLYVPEDASMASLVNWTEGIGGNVHTVKCALKRLDDLVESGEVPLPQFIKCDVEGAELSVFRGGAKTLDRANAPVIMFEVNAKAAKSFGAKTSDYFALLDSFTNANYTFFEVTPDGISPLTSRKIEYANVAAVPALKLDSFDLA